MHAKTQRGQKSNQGWMRRDDKDNVPQMRPPTLFPWTAASLWDENAEARMAEA